MNQRHWGLIILSIVLGCSKPADKEAAGLNDAPDAVDQNAQSDDTAEVAASEEITSEEEKTTVEDQVAERITLAIEMLEAEKYSEFLNSFLVPAELKAVKDDGKFGDVLKNFSRRNAPELLGALKSIQGTQPRMSDDQKIAWFETEQRIASSNVFALVFVDGDWFVPNRPPKE